MQLRDAVARVDEVRDLQEVQHRMIVMHAGLTDFVDGADPESEAAYLKGWLLEQLDQSPSNYYLIFAVPEIKGLNERLDDKCMKWNAVVQGICRELSPRVELVRTTCLKYTAEAARLISTRLGRRACAFLGRPQQGSTRNPAQKTRSATPAAGLHTRSKQNARGGDLVQRPHVQYAVDADFRQDAAPAGTAVLSYNTA